MVCDDFDPCSFDECQSGVCIYEPFEDSVFVPNAFTPNGDGINDILYVYGLKTDESLIFQIFDRWGELIFESYDTSTGWDGTSHGRRLPSDVFVYVLRNRCGTGYMKGSITLIR